MGSHVYNSPFKTGFEATAPNGERISGTVCEGWFKGKLLGLING